MEDVIQEEGMKDFKRTSRVGVTAFLAQWCSNKHGHYLALAEYDGLGRKGFIVVQEGKGGKGWSSFSLELRLVLYFLFTIYGGGSRPRPAVVQRGGRLSHGLGGSVPVHALKPPKEVVGYRSYAEFLKERPTSSSSVRGISGNFVSTSLKGQLIRRLGLASHRDVGLVRLKTEVSRIDWVDLGLGPAGLGSRSGPEKVALVEPKSSPIVNILSKHPSNASKPDPPLVAHSNPISKGKDASGFLRRMFPPPLLLLP